MKVTIAGIELPGVPPDLSTPLGLYVKREGLKDWYSVTPSKAPNVPRRHAHGSFNGGYDWREGAVPSVQGGYLGSSEADALAMMDVVRGAWTIGTNVEMAVEDALRTTSRQVSIRYVDIPDHKGLPRFEFTVVTFANDPRRYGETVTVSTGLPVIAGGLTWPITWPITWGGGGSDGRVTLVNPGTEVTVPLLEVTGGLGGGFSLTEVGTGREVRFERQVPDGSTIFLNPKTGRAYIDAPGNDVSTYLTRSEWPSVPPSGQTVLQFNSIGAVTGTPILTAHTAPAY